MDILSGGASDMIGRFVEPLHLELAEAHDP